MVPVRDTALQDELNKQNSNDALRAKFATQANTVGAYIQAKMEVKDTALAVKSHSPQRAKRFLFAQLCVVSHSFSGELVEQRVISDVLFFSPT